MSFEDGTFWKMLFEMHWFGWLFWFAVFVLFAVLLTQAFGRVRRRRASPVEILQRRYANGEISTEAYEERRKRIEQDAAKQ